MTKLFGASLLSGALLLAGGCARSEPPSTLQSSNTKGGPEATKIDRAEPLCPQLEAAAEAAISSLLTKHDVVEREWKFDVLPRVDCWSADDRPTSKARGEYVWIYYPRQSARGVAVLGLLYLGGSGSWPGFNMPDLVREWRDELIRRGFSPRAEKWDLKLVSVGPHGPGFYGGTQVCAIYSHGSDMVDYTDLGEEVNGQTDLTYAIRWAGELCHEPTPEQRAERRKSHEEWARLCREGELPPDMCQHLSD
jgi:hypothetical protein